MSTLPETCLQTARLFADALDNCDFGKARSFLAENCVYAFRDKVVTGRDGIIATYQANAEWAEEAFDRMAYESCVAGAGADQVRVTFVDRTEHRGMRHLYTCQQVLTFDRDDAIVRIDHVDLEGQTQALEAFLHKCGVDRRTMAD